MKSKASEFLEMMEKEQIDNVHSKEGHLSSEYGFLPLKEPKTQLPISHKIWDDMVNKLPDYLENLTIIEKIDKMKTLSADSDHLGDEYLLRASLLLKSMAHAYFFAKTMKENMNKDAVILPVQIESPWKQVTERLHRKIVGRNVTDDFLYNWKLKDSSSSRTYNNMKLLVPYFKEKSERRMTLCVIAMESAFAPAVGAIARVQDAILNNDNISLKIEIKKIIEYLRNAVYALYKINPITYSKTHVDPIIWARTFGKISGGWYKGEKGNSGAQSPMFHLMDAFIGREIYKGMAAKEIENHYHFLPETHRSFIEKVKNGVKIEDYISNQNDEELKNLYHSLLEAYYGDYGVLGYHRHKIFGIINLSIFDGRQETNNISLPRSNKNNLPFHAQLDNKLTEGIDEREKNKFKIWNDVVVERTDVNKVVLSVEKSGLFYKPGDHIEVLPENGNDFIDIIMNSLELKSRNIDLNDRWKEEMRKFYNLEVKEIDIREFFKHAQMRILKKGVIEKIYENYERKDKIIQWLDENSNKKDDGVTFIDFISHCGIQELECFNYLKLAFNVGNLCHFFDPMLPRKYSITKINDRFIELTVGRVEYPSKFKEYGKNCGTASSQLLNALPGTKIKVRVDVANHFHMPDDPKIPLIMFSAGSGVSPFISFIENRAIENDFGKLILVASMHEDNPYHRDQLINYAKEGRIDLYLVYSKYAAYYSKEESLLIPGNHNEKALSRLFCDKHFENAKKLIIENDAHVYVCGNSGYAETILNKIRQLVLTKNKKFTNEFFARKYHEETYDINPSSKKDKKFYPSEIKKFNNKKSGFYISIDGKIFDIKNYMNKHPGGSKILMRYAGLNATDDFNRVKHNFQPEVLNILERNFVGYVHQTNISDSISVFYKYLSLMIDKITVLENKSNVSLNFSDEVTQLINNQSLKKFLEEFSNIISGIFSETKIQLVDPSNKLDNILFNIINSLNNFIKSNFYEKALEISEYLKDTISENDRLREIYVNMHNRISNIFINNLSEIKFNLISIAVDIEREFSQIDIEESIKNLNNINKIISNLSRVFEKNFKNIFHQEIESHESSLYAKKDVSNVCQYGHKKYLDNSKFFADASSDVNKGKIHKSASFEGNLNEKCFERNVFKI